MTFRLRSLLAAVTASLFLAACGGGTTTVAPNPGPNPGPPGPAGSLSLSSSTLNFVSAASAPQTVTISTTIASPVPTFNNVNCGGVATINSTASTITVTPGPAASGVCAVVITIDNVSATLTITVGGTAGLTTTTNSAISVALGGAASFNVSAGTGTWTLDSTSCSKYATFSPSGSGATVTYGITPTAAGTCTATAVDTLGHGLVLQPIVVTSGNTASSLSLTPPALAFSVSSSAAPKTFTLSVTGTAGLGALTLDESSCWNGGNSGSPRIAYATLNGASPGATVTPPATFTVTLFTPAQGGQTGSCAINFTSGGVVYGSEAITVGP